jgi:hypothetical protein
MVAGCGDDDPEPDRRGEAAVAVAQFCEQEKNGGLLPEGFSVIESGTEEIVELPVSDDQANEGVDARVCAEFAYTTAVDPFPAPRRVYAAAKTDGAWSVEVVNPDGSCEDVI